jgi:hypothetical protein
VTERTERLVIYLGSHAPYVASNRNFHFGRQNSSDPSAH